MVSISYGLWCSPDAGVCTQHCAVLHDSADSQQHFTYTMRMSLKAELLLDVSASTWFPVLRAQAGTAHTGGAKAGDNICHLLICRPSTVSDRGASAHGGIAQACCSGTALALSFSSCLARPTSRLKVAKAQHVRNMPCQSSHRLLTSPHGTSRP